MYVFSISYGFSGSASLGHLNTRLGRLNSTVGGERSGDCVARVRLNWKSIRTQLDPDGLVFAPKKRARATWNLLGLRAGLYVDLHSRIGLLSDLLHVDLLGRLCRLTNFDFAISFVAIALEFNF